MGFVSPSISISPRVVALVEKYENIKLRYISLDDLFSLESPLHELWLSGKVQESHWSVSHTSDIVRYMLLYKYGGVWLDTDVISVQQLPNKKNFVSAELASKAHLAAGAIKFQKHHQVLQDILHNLNTQFSGTDWGANGPMQLTRAMRQYCEDGGEHWHNSDPAVTSCGDVTIYKQDHFYPINWRQWYWLYKAEYTGPAMEKLDSSYIVHLWGSHSKGAGVEDDSAIMKIASEHCPVSKDWIL